MGVGEIKGWGRGIRGRARDRGRDRNRGRGRAWVKVN